MKIYFINRFFYPDFSATSQLLTDLAVEMSRHHDVTAVASRKLYNDPLAMLDRRGEFEGVEILRVNTTRLGRDKLWRRAIDYASFYVRIGVFLLRNIKRGDLVVLMTDPPLIQLINTAIIRLKGGRVINWLQDIYPEIAERLGAFPGPPWLSRMVQRWRNRALRKAAMNVAIGPNMKEFLAAQGVSNVEIIHNWTDDEDVRPLEHADNHLREDWALSDCTAVMYSGNFGRVHRFEALVDAADMLHNEEHIRFVLVGEGAALEDVYNDVQSRNLKNVRFEPYQARDKLRLSLGAADIHLVSLNHLMEGLVFPSKLFGVLAAGRPLVFLGEDDSDIAKIIAQHDIGEVVPPDDGALLADAIRRLAGDARHRRAMGARARALCEDQFSKAHALAGWKKLLSELT